MKGWKYETQGNIFGFTCFFVLITFAAGNPMTEATEVVKDLASTQSAETEVIEQEPNTASAAGCPVGEWQITDFAPYMTSLQQNLTAMTDNEYAFSGNEYSGSAQFDFENDLTAIFSAENFTQEFTMSTSGIDIPIIIEINGSSTSEYAIVGDQISFSNQDAGDLIVKIDIMGSPSTLDENLLGEPGTIKLYNSNCPNPDTLTLKVIAVEDMDLAPLTLTR